MGLVLEGFTTPTRIRQVLLERANLQISLQQVREDLEYVRTEWKETRIKDYDGVMARELQKIDHLETVAWTEWKRSQDPRKKKASKTVFGGNNPRTEETENEEEALGDPRYLDQVRWCIDRRCKLLGLDDKLTVTRKIDRPTDKSLADASSEEIHLTLERVFSSLSVS